ncbi:MAG TPA: thioredoxin-dependent thiol peroxidase [Egibacteraceae bacterium]
MNVKVGDPAPDITLPDQHGRTWSLQDHRGTPVVVYFYPKDDTPGCTTQACDVRDHWAEFSELGVPVVGISPDTVDSHAAFAGKHDLPHTLLADPDKQVIGAYGAWGEKSMYGKRYEGVIRSSVVIDRDGVIAAVFDKIQPKQQSAKALEVVRGL